MRLLVMTNMYPPHHYGGYELLCQGFVEAMRAAGHDVLVLTSDITVPGAPPETATDGSVRRDLRLYWDDHVVLEPGPRESLAIERANEAAFRRALDDHRPDVVSAWHMGALSMGLLHQSRAAGVPLVHVICDDWLVYAPGMDRWARLWRRSGPLASLGERLFGVHCRVGDLGRLGAFCFISDTTKAGATSVRGMTFPSCTVNYSGIDTHEFPVAHEPPPRDWAWRLLHVGRIEDRKGVDVAVRALALLPPEATLRIVGWGDDAYLAELRELTVSLGVADRVAFSTATRAELRAIYAETDAFLFLPRWAEPFGLVPIEAMACATPVIATGTGGSGEFLLDEVNCLRVPNGDAAAVAAAVQRLADDAALRSRLVTGGAVTADELTLARWCESLEAWHRAAADGSPTPPDRPSIGPLLRTRISQA